VRILKLCVPGTRLLKLFTIGAANDALAKPSNSPARSVSYGQGIPQDKPEACAKLGSQESFLHRNGAGLAEAGALLEAKHRLNSVLFRANWN
jgi:hypothetical protein